jgi:hypothetical protein
MPSRVVHFLRPTFVALVLFALVAGVANIAWYAPRATPESTPTPGLSPLDVEGVDLTGVVLPSSELTPAQVVRLQLAGLSDASTGGVGILQCYCFASPANRAMTGPLDQFGRMVRQGPYQSMARPRALLVGRPQYDGQVARVLVTVVAEDSGVSAFTFVLSRQEAAPFQDCWMTEAVLPAMPMAAPDSLPTGPTA